MSAVVQRSSRVIELKRADDLAAGAALSSNSGSSKAIENVRSGRGAGA